MKIKASPYTRLYWNSYQLDTTNNNTRIIFDQEIVGNLALTDLTQLIKVFTNVIQHYPLINSHLVEENNELYWEMNTESTTLEVFSNDKLVQEFIDKSFNLDKGPLFRFGLFKLTNTKYKLILLAHPALMNINEFYEFIELLAQNYIFKETIAPKKTIATIQKINCLLHHKVQKARDSSAQQFWQNSLCECTAKVELPYQKTDLSSTGEYRFSLNKKSINQENLLYQNPNLFCYLIACYGYLLSCYCQNQHVHIAYQVMFNEITEIDSGSQTNTLVLPLAIKTTDTPTTLIEQVKRHIQCDKFNDAHCYNYLPTIEILANSPIRHLNVAFTQVSSQNTPIIPFNDCEVSLNEPVNLYLAGTELYLDYRETHDCLNFRCCYDSQLFSQEFIVNLCECYSYLTQNLFQTWNIHTPLHKQHLLNTQDYHQQIYSWNQTQQTYPRDKTLHQLFEEQVLNTPDNVAVIYNETTLSYLELNQKANQLAHYLSTNYRIKSDDLIALYLERSEQMLIGILGVLKSGAAYVPLEPGYPSERIRYQLDDTFAKAILTNKVNHDRLLQLIGDNVTPIISLDTTEFKDILNNYPTSNPTSLSQSRNLAYVIYTSGTTGKPKGVMIEHRSVVNTVVTTAYLYKSSHKINRVTYFTSFVFDVSLSEIFTNLLLGNELHIFNEQTRRDVVAIADYLNTHKINITYLPPVILSQLPRNIWFQHLERIIYAGEPCANDTGLYWSTAKELMNYYGPTEASIYCIGKQVTWGDTHIIGKPLPNTTAYILDQNLKPLPIGAIGELYVGGEGLARGYLNLPDLTDERFISNHFQTDAEKAQNLNTRLYKTGDLVRYLPDGNIEYIGRNDFQVKIRGFRIELGEIENKLAGLTGVKQAVVLTQEHKEFNGTQTGSKYLVGYYVAEAKLDEESMLIELAELLPDYMLPSVLLHLDRLPLTINGKLDRKALPKVFFTCNKSYIAPETELEILCCEMSAKILGLSPESVGLMDNFFKLGGDSISAYKFISKLDVCGYALTLQSLIDSKNIKELALRVIKKNLKGMYDDFFEEFSNEYKNSNNTLNLYTPEAEIVEHLIRTPFGIVWSEIGYTTISKNRQALIFVQGGPSGSHDYLRTLTPLCAHAPVIFFDQIGGGRSVIPQDLNLCNINNFSEVIYHIIQYYGYSKINLFADCLGTMVAIKFAKNHPEFVDRLILASPMISIDHHYKDIVSKIEIINLEHAKYIRDMQKGEITMDVQRLIQIDKEFSDIHMLAPKFYNQLLLDTFKNVNKEVAIYLMGDKHHYYLCNGSLSQENVAEIMYGVNAKTLIILGDADIISELHLNEILKRIPQARVEIFKNCAHWPHIEQTQQLISLIATFIQNQE